MTANDFLSFLACFNFIETISFGSEYVQIQKFITTLSDSKHRP